MKAVITGATKGIGEAIAFKLAMQGFDLAMCSRNLNELESLKIKILKLNPSCQLILKAFDLKDKSGIKEFSAEIISGWQSVDMLVNNAGIFIPSGMMKEEDAVFEEHLSVNLAAAYYLSKAIIPSMMERKKGHVFNICSSASLGPKYNAGSYSISKYALKGFTDNLREELKTHNIKVTGIFPGSVYTGSWEGTGIAQENFIQPQDIADLLFNAFSLSGASSVDNIVINPVIEI